MTDWLRPLLKMFYAPARGMAEVRDRAPLLPAVLLAFIAHGAYLLYVLWPNLLSAEELVWNGFGGFASVAWKVAGDLLFTAIVFVPVVIFVSNMMERRASFGIALQQEYAPVASAVLYARTLASLLALPFAALMRVSGIEAMNYHMLGEMANKSGTSIEELLAEKPFLLAESFAFTIMLPLLTLWVVIALIHVQRKELDEARARFERAVEIDADELDAHYQLGRIARTQNRLPDAIKNFGEVVARDPSHSQHEIWREIGATYLAAGQFTDAQDALECFLERRQSDPEGLYLMGRAHAGLGRQREAVEWMKACIEAVKTSPAYKYRAEKRWLNEAQQFLRSQA
ncbi:MAG: tetratricopeptide repeat protein [Acidobacteria bacterium]|nr:tetratricopeptide repeat protein [Acidobacteriota bacterium]